MSDPITTYMSLTVPTPQVTLGPQFATNISGDMFIIDGHDHVTVGKPLTQAAFTIGGDVSYNNNNATSLRSVRFQQQSGDLVGAQDLAALYTITPTGDLVFNDGSGIPIQITANHTLNVAALPNATALVGVSISAVSYVISSVSTFNLLEIHTASNAVTVTLPSASAFAGVKRYYYFNDESNNFATHNFTLNAPAGNNLYVNGIEVSSSAFTSNGQNGFIYTDGVSNWYVMTFSQITYTDQSLTISGGGSSLSFTDSAQLLTDSSSLSQFTGNVEMLGTNVIAGASTDISATITTFNGAAVTLNSPTSIINIATISGAGGIVSNISGGIVSLHASGILSDAANGIGTGTGKGIYSGVALGITTNVAGGIAPYGSGTITDGGLAGGITITAAGGLALATGSSVSGVNTAISLDSTSTLTVGGVTTLAGLVLQDGVNGNTGLPFALNGSGSKISVPNGTGHTLSTAEQAWPTLIIATVTLTIPTILELGGLREGSTYHILANSVSGLANLSIQNGGANPIAVSGSNTLIIATCFDTTHVSVNG